MDALIQIGSTETIGNIYHLATTACTGMAATELVGLSILGVAGILVALGILTFLAWLSKRAIFMVFIGILWVIPAVYGFAQMSSNFDVYGILATTSLLGVAICWTMPLWTRTAVDIVPEESPMEDWSEQFERKRVKKKDKLL